MATKKATTATATTPAELKAQNLTKPVKTLDKATTPTAQEKLATQAEAEALAKTKAEQKAEAKAEALQTKRADKQLELTNLIAESTAVITAGQYDTSRIGAIKSDENNENALELITAELKLLKQAHRDLASNEARATKRIELEAELKEFEQYADATELKTIADTSDNKTANALLQNAIRSAKNKKIASANAEFSAEIEQMFAHGESETESMQLLGSDDLSLDKFEQTLKSRIETLANNLREIDENGNPLVPNSALPTMLNFSETDKRVRFIQDGLIGMELKNRIALKRQATGLSGDGFVETLKRMAASGELQGHYVTLQKNTNIVETFYDYLVGVDVEKILPREHYVTMLTWSKQQDKPTLDKFFNDAPVMNDGSPIQLNDVKAMVTTATAEVGLDSGTGAEVLKDSLLTIKISVANYADAVDKAIMEHGSMQAFVEYWLQAQYIAIDATGTDAELTQDEIDSALADFDVENDIDITDTTNDLTFDSDDADDADADETDDFDDFD